MIIGSKTEPVRLEKKTTFRQKIKEWILSKRYYFLLIVVFIVFVLFFTVLFFLTPHVESGQYYYFKV